MPQRTCSIDDCDSPISARGWCPLHYGRWKRHGDPLTDVVKPPTPHGASTEERLRHVGWTKTYVVPALGPCWEWNGRRTRYGYGIFYADHTNQKASAHRAAYIAWVGPIPDGRLIRHRCDNRACIRPEHLEPGTHADNATDAVVRGRRYQKLTAAQHREIREGFTGAFGEQTLLAAEYGVSVSLIHLIVRGKLTRHPGGEAHGVDVDGGGGEGL